MRIVLFTGKGGVGKTTTASATAYRLADRGVKTLLLSTDIAHSLADAMDVELTDEPVEVAPSLWAVQIDTQGRFEAAWRDVQAFLIDMLAKGGVDPITADELTVLPGVDEVLALLAVRELADAGDWDALVVDCAPTAETLRLLALPEALGGYLERLFPAHRRAVRGLLAGLAGGPQAGRGETALRWDRAAEALDGLAVDLAGLRALGENAGGVDAGAEVLGGGWSLPRGRTGLPLRLAGGRSVLVPTRDPVALRAALLEARGTLDA
jgi:arsenite-transporting ATPase